VRGLTVRLLPGTSCRRREEARLVMQFNTKATARRDGNTRLKCISSALSSCLLLLCPRGMITDPTALVASGEDRT